tara:strand:+ start:4231 stop:4449 length:219 start_codon:yes stop_codon:yes gene_type:complete
MNRERSSPLLLREEEISHPFRQRLPTTMLQIAKEQQESDSAAVPKAGGIGDDTSLFVLSFLAFFIAFYTFIF